MIKNAFTSIGQKHFNGYEPKYDSIKKIYTTPIYTENNLSATIDTSCINLLNETLQLLKQKNIKTIICFSPWYFNRSTKPLVYQAFQQLQQQQQFTMLDYSSDTNYLQKPYLFYDEMHLNHTGAIQYSKSIAEEINKIK
jgi:lysophospholipase L1-like esterase